MDTVMTVMAPVRNRIATREPNFRIYRAISILNRGAWYLDQHTRGMYIYVLYYVFDLFYTKIRYAFRN